MHDIPVGVGGGGGGGGGGGAGAVNETTSRYIAVVSCAGYNDNGKPMLDLPMAKQVDVLRGW